jgi:hypothetical protein
VSCLHRLLPSEPVPGPVRLSRCNAAALEGSSEFPNRSVPSSNKVPYGTAIAPHLPTLHCTPVAGAERPKRDGGYGGVTEVGRRRSRFMLSCLANLKADLFPQVHRSTRGFNCYSGGARRNVCSAISTSLPSLSVTPPSAPSGLETPVPSHGGLD